jgi:hypothetical protein
MLTDTDSPRPSLVPEPNPTSIGTTLALTMYFDVVEEEREYSQNSLSKPRGWKKWPREFYRPKDSLPRDRMWADELNFHRDDALALFLQPYGEAEIPVYESDVAVPSSPEHVPSTAGQTYRVTLSTEAQTLHTQLQHEYAGGDRKRSTFAVKKLSIGKGDQPWHAEVQSLGEILACAGCSESSRVVALLHRSGSRNVIRSFLSETERAAARGDKACAALLGELRVVIDFEERREWWDYLVTLTVWLGEACAACPVVMYQSGSPTPEYTLVGQEPTPLGGQLGTNLLSGYRRSIEGLLSRVSIRLLLLRSKLTYITLATPRSPRDRHRRPKPFALRARQRHPGQSRHGTIRAQQHKHGAEANPGGWNGSCTLGPVFFLLHAGRDCDFSSHCGHTHDDCSGSATNAGR